MRQAPAGYAIFEQLAALCKLTDRSFVALKSANVPDATLEKLKPLKDIGFNPEGMITKLRSVLDQEELTKYSAVILRNSMEMGYGPAHVKVAQLMIPPFNP